MKILIVGADGYCGWATSLELLNAGHSIHMVDNFLRRRIDQELGISPARALPSFVERREAAEKRFQQSIGFDEIDVASEHERLLELLRELKPDVVMDFAKIRSAPYSMRNFNTGRKTLMNNMLSTYNIASAICEVGLDTHLIHIGTMGVYGYAGEQRIPEGLDFTFAPRGRLHSNDPGSLYHLSKVSDQHILFLLHKTHGLRVTEYHQGIVWGFDTELSASAPSLGNRWDYDGDYGTVLNRFVVQALTIGDLTVYGGGNQVRPFIALTDTVRALTRIAIAKSPSFRIINGFTEAKSINQVAEVIQQVSRAHISHIENPRREIENTSYPADHLQIRQILETEVKIESGIQDFYNSVRIGIESVDPLTMNARPW